jgi:acetate kinase
MAQRQKNDVDIIVIPTSEETTIALHCSATLFRQVGTDSA